jgi:hypothetical protein
MYGVDQCRVCGKPIAVKSPKAIEDQERAIRKPIVPEKVWRARGYLTAPTGPQWRANPSDGCCGDCGVLELRRKYRHVIRFWTLAGAAVTLAVILITILKFMPH